MTQKPRPERSLAIALENVTPEAVEGLAGHAAGAAPRVTASGRGAVAEQILQIAFERGVKVRTDSDLAEILAAVEVESEIPLAALAGVAEILRYLYQTDTGQTDTGQTGTGQTDGRHGGQESDEEKQA
ncbi:EscU/YscU/HrcU family type III secretion system export apparatus switch protein [Pelagibius sp. CAU 1746]|uniref:EscU/YscU/HrcU family type III secretion system export apparatus switch protein n=1 Tax=Pelagibius sp. CAU 1746 TaxID=3140370 RepID=UPI00325AB31A